MLEAYNVVMPKCRKLVSACKLLLSANNLDIGFFRFSQFNSLFDHAK